MSTFVFIVIIWRQAMDGVQPVLYPRFLPKMLTKQTKQACVVGSVIDVSENNSFTLECDPESKQQLVVQIPAHIQANSLKNVKFIEIRGVLLQSGDILMRQYTDLKDNFDLKTYNEIVGLAFREFKDIFNYSS